MKKLCTQCLTVGKPRKVARGSILMEIFLWCLFIVPGFIYSLWRLSTKANACKSCGSENLVKLNSPMAKKLLKDVA